MKQQKKQGRREVIRGHDSLAIATGRVQVMFAERLKTIASRAEASAAKLETEEATKNALVMPFIQALGYDVFDPEEVVPEFTADVGTKKGEKVDYAIRRSGELIMLFECKRAGEKLDGHASQLFRYFTVTDARIAVLTNGIQYRFFSDLEKPNRMDERPFLSFDLNELKDNTIAQLSKLTRENFSLETMIDAASGLKHQSAVRQFLEEQLSEPSEEFVRLCYGQAVPSGRFSKSVREQFTGIVARALSNLVSDRVSDRLRNALERADEDVDRSEAPPAEVGGAEAQQAPTEDGSGVLTTDEELEGYRIVKAIVCGVAEPSRIVMRDAKSYCAIIFDDNNRKPICRLHFDRSKKYLGLFDEDKVESRHDIEGPEAIYAFADQLRATVQRYL